MGSTSATASQGVSGAERESPSKRRKLGDKTVFDGFFIKKEQVQVGGDEPQGSSHPAAAAQNSSSSSLQSQTVSCPVCQNEVVESQINEHLDQCLERDGDSVQVGTSLWNKLGLTCPQSYLSSMASVTQEGAVHTQICGLWSNSCDQYRILVYILIHEFGMESTVRGAMFTLTLTLHTL